MLGNHCGRCGNSFIDNPDCPCACHQPERDLLVTTINQRARQENTAHVATIRKELADDA